MTWPN